MTTKPRYTTADRQPPKQRGPIYFLEFLRIAGIRLTVDAGGRLQIHAPKNNVSPLLEQEIRSREAALVELVREQIEQVAQPALKPVAVEPTAGDRLIYEGIQNARKAEQRKAAIASKVKR